MANPEVAIVIKAKDEASKTLSGIGSKLGGLGKFAMLGAAGIGAAAVGIGVAAFKIGADFDKAYDRIKVGTGATGEALKGLQGDFKEVFKGVPTDMQSASGAIADLNTLLGVSGETLQGMAKDALNAGRMMGEDTAGLIKQASRALNVFEIGGKDAVGVYDMLFVASQKTGIGMTELASSLQTYGPVLKNMGFGLEETTAFMSSMHKAGIDISRIMPGINAATRKWAKEGITDLKGELYKAIEQIKGATTESEALNIATEIFGAEGAQRMVSGIRSGALELDKLTEVLGDSLGAINKTNQATMSAGEKFTIMKNKAMTAFEPIASRLFDLAGVVMDKMMPAMESLATWIDTSLVPAFDNLGKIISPIIGFVGRIFGGEAQGAISGFAATIQPVLTVFQSIGQLISTHVIPFIREMSAEFQKFAEFIGPLIKPAMDNILNIIKPAMDNILNVITTVMSVIVGFFDRHWDKIEKIFGGVWKVIQGIVKVAWAIVSGILKVGLALLAGDWDKAWTGIKDMLNEVWEGIKLIISGALDIITGELGLAWDAIADTTRWAWEGIKDTILGVWEGIKSGIASAINWMIDRFNSFVKSVNKIIEGINKVPGINIPTIPIISRMGAERPLSYMPEFHYGGIVPGPIGQPVPAIVHGGEEIITHRERREGRNIQFFFDFKGADLGGLTVERVEQIFREAALQEKLYG